MMLRKATLADADRLLKWRNDELTRLFSLNPKPVTQQEHMVWLQNSLINKQRLLLIAEIDNNAIGTVRADSQRKINTISWTLSPDYRGKGLAKEMVALFVIQLEGLIMAKILPGNTPSIHVAEYAGLSYEHTQNNVMYYVRTNPITNKRLIKQ